MSNPTTTTTTTTSPETDSLLEELIPTVKPKKVNLSKKPFITTNKLKFRKYGFGQAGANGRVYGQRIKVRKRPVFWAGNANGGRGNGNADRVASQVWSPTTFSSVGFFFQTELEAMEGRRQINLL